MKRILVPVDFSPITETVLDTAKTLARALRAEIVLLHVAQPEPEFITYEPGPESVRQAVAREMTENHRKVQALHRQLETENIPATSLVVQGYIVEKILQEIERLNIDLVVMGSHGRSALYHMLLGSVSEGVLKKSKRPILIVPAPKP
ncbi:MAG: universal stress protein [Verrucomicrobia bacterium]|nr:universal stress protein [Kiritimatiellia bacterium]MCO6401847.1 universal stress protein [Verrucomicrobiota bacterium]